jgi:hypothetical protein
VRGSYHITVAVPKLAGRRGCPVGLTGRVSFNDGRLEATAATAPIVRKAPTGKSAGLAPLLRWKSPNLADNAESADVPKRSLSGVERTWSLSSFGAAIRAGVALQI